MKTILVTGGAGYIGSAAVKTLCKKRYKVIVIDNLSRGLKKLVDQKALFYKAELSDKKALEQIFRKHKIDAVMHFAAYKAVGESMEDAPKYTQNITGTAVLLDCMVKHGVRKIIYSSSAAVYGMPKKSPISEDAETKPINYYGYTKLACGEMIRWYHLVHGISYISLRYFNVAGDAGLNYIDPDAENIFPIIMEVITKKREKLTIFGKDYNTPDGTCVRDYIDIQDLVDAHILALNCKYSGDINLGTSRGVSVKELVEETRKVTGMDFPFIYGKRRAGDPAHLVASNKLAKKVLGWKPKKSLKEMIRSTFDAYNLTLRKS